MQDAVDAFEDYEVAPEKFTAVGDAVLVHVRVTGRGRASGVPLEARVVQAWVLRDGQVVRAEVYPDEKEALEAVGLSE
jgi:ketosteroid isomerase-like protein